MTTTGTYLKLRAKLPEGRDNGLDDPNLAERLRHDPHVVYLVVMAEPVAVTENLETSAYAVTLGLDAVEVLDSDVARKLLADRFRERTGIAELPLEDGPPAGVDPVTGELVIDGDNVVDVVAEALADAAAAAGLPATVTTSKGRTKK